MLFPVSETHFFTLNALGVNFWNYLVFGNDFFRWSEGSWKLSEFLYIFGILWYVHLCPIVFYWWKFHNFFCWTDAGSLSPSYQPKVGFCSSVWSRNLFSPYFFWDFSSLISPFLFSLSCKKSKLSLQSKMPKNRILFFPENKSLTDADCLYMFHYNGELAWVIYGDIINSVGIIRISFSRRI